MTDRQCFLCDRTDQPLVWHGHYCQQCVDKHPEYFPPDPPPGPLEPNIIARIHLYKNENGALKNPLLPPVIKCPMKIDGVESPYYDCGIFLHEIGPVVPGQTFEAPIQFLCPDLLVDKLRVGTRFNLFAGRKLFFAEGEVLEIFPSLYDQ